MQPSLLFLLTFKINRMNRFLLSLAAAAFMSGSAYSMYLVGAPAGEWNPAIGIEMTEVEGGWQWSGYVGAEEYFTFATQLEASGDWSTFNANYRLNPPADGTPAASGEYTLTLGGQDAAFRGLGADCTFFISNADGNYTLTITTDGQETPVDPPTPGIASWGMIGAFNGWSGDMEMRNIANDYWAVFVPELDGEFKFRGDADWSVNYGASNGNENVSADGTYPMEANGLNFVVNDTTNINLIIDLSNSTLRVKHGGQISNLAFLGSINDWSWNLDYCFYGSLFDPGAIIITLPELPAGCQFKIADSTWSEEYTSEILDMQPGKAYNVISSGGTLNMGVSETFKDVEIMLNPTAKIMTFNGTPGSAVSEIADTEAAAEYFNLQGVRVSNPQSGMYIRVAGGKTEKVILK